MNTSRAVVAAAALVVVVGALPVAFGAGSADSISVGDTVTGTPNGTIDAAPGDTVTVRVWANATGVRGYQTNLTFDPSVVTVESISGSDEFAQTDTTVDNDGGWVAVTQIRSTETSDPVLAEVTLSVAADASSSTSLSFVESDTKFSDSDAESFTPDSFNNVEVAVDNGSEQTTETGTPPGNGTATPTPTETGTPPEDGTATPTPTETGDDSDDSDDGSSNDDNDGSSSDDDNNNNAGGGGGGGGGGGAISPPEPSFTIVETSLNRTAVAPGDPISVSGTVENDGDEDGTFEGYVSSNGTAMGANTTVEIPEREERQVNVTVRFDSPGVYAVSLNSTAVGTVTVRAANVTGNTTANATGNETTNTTTNGTVNATGTATPERTASTTDADPTTETATATETATPAATATDSEGEATPASGIQTATTDGSGPGFGAASVAVSLSLLLGWLGYRRPDE